MRKKKLYIVTVWLKGRLDPIRITEVKTTDSLLDDKYGPRITIVTDVRDTTWYFTPDEVQAWVKEPEGTKGTD
jgi:hypothetical protein